MSGNARDRRRMRRLSRLPGSEMVAVASGVVAPPPTIDQTHPLGTEYRITSDEYGKTYARIKGVVCGYDGGKVLLQTTRRKAPLPVSTEHLEPLNKAA